LFRVAQLSCDTIVLWRR